MYIHTKLKKCAFKPFSLIKVTGGDTTASKREAWLSSTKGKNIDFTSVSDIKIASDGKGLFETIHEVNVDSLGHSQWFFGFGNPSVLIIDFVLAFLFHKPLYVSAVISPTFSQAELSLHTVLAASDSGLVLLPCINFTSSISTFQFPATVTLYSMLHSRECTVGDPVHCQCFLHSGSTTILSEE